MCGSENDFAPAELVRLESESRWSENETSFRGRCRNCGEPIDVRGRTAVRKSRRLEAVVAFAVLAVLVLLFVVAVFTMHKA